MTKTSSELDPGSVISFRDIPPADPALVNEATQLMHWDTQLRSQRPTGIAEDESWFCFLDALEDRLPVGAKVDIKHLGGGQLIARHGDTSLSWPSGKWYTEQRVLDALTVDSAQDTPALGRTLGEVLANPTKTEWILEGKIERETTSLIVGARGTCKTFIGIDWGLQAAVKGHRVCFVSAEGADFDRRAAAWLKTYAPTVDPATLPVRVIEKRLDLSTVQGVQALRDECIRNGEHPELFCLDTFSKLSGSIDENDNAQVRQFLLNIDRGLKRRDTGFGAAVLLIAHTGHGDQSRARGASALAADTECEFIVTRQRGSDVVSVSRERFKSSPELPPLMYRTVSVDLTREPGDPISSLVLVPEESAASVRPTTKRPKPDSRIGITLGVLEDLVTRNGGNPVPLEQLREAAVNRLVPPAPGAWDRRSQRVGEDINKLLAAGHAHWHGSHISNSRKAPSDAPFDASG